MNKRPVLTEYTEQATFVHWVKLQYQHHAEFEPGLFFSTQNGMNAGGATQAQRFMVVSKQKAAGMIKGVADLIYLQPRGQFHYMCIEMKRVGRHNRKDGDRKPEQVEFGKAVENNGGYYVVTYGADEAMTRFAFYMELILHR